MGMHSMHRHLAQNLPPFGVRRRGAAFDDEPWLVAF
jgi:hypothetical protein